MKKHQLSILALAVASASVSMPVLASAPGASSSVDYSTIHGYMTISDPTFVSVSSGSFLQNQAVVAPGSELKLSFDAGVKVTSTVYCPNCIQEEYLAWTDDALKAGASPGQFNIMMDIQQHDITANKYTWTTKAPTKPGEYFIGGAGTLDYQYVPVTGTFGGKANELAPFKVTVSAVPEPESASLICVGLVLIGARRMSQRHQKTFDSN